MLRFATIPLTVMTLAVFLGGPAPAVAEGDPPPGLADDPRVADAVKEAVVKAYIEGIWINRDSDAVRAGFHEEFTMYYLADGELKMRSRDDTHLYTDYLSLYRFDDGWKIVAKIFHAHTR